ncbi:MAG TPA: 4Fe-4S binding protein [Candidatus Limnocylindria bacterium]|nr:4Fe-4S binding protein [Candidatus Limnocylindria bacterium]
MDKGAIYAGIALAHPIIAASAGTTRDLDHCLRCEDAGFSAVILKSVQEEVLMRHNPFPRFKVLRSGVRSYESTTFYCYEQAYEGDIDDYCETVSRVKARLSVPVVASVNCITLQAWPEYAKACEQAGADALEIVPSCPTGMLMRESANDIHSIVVAALREVKAAVGIPVIPKMTRQLADIPFTARALDQAGADGITMLNRSTGLDIDVRAQAPVLHGGYAGHGGSWSLYEVLRWITAVQGAVRAPICATGGAMTGEDVVKCLLAGAQSVQVASVLYLKGYGWVREMLRWIDAYMEEMSIERLGDVVGRAARAMKRMDEYDRVHEFYAVCDAEKCRKCGLCADVCIYEALDASGGAARIDPQKCDGCGLCAGVCRHGAITMIGRSGTA